MGRVLHASKSGFFPFCLDFSQTYGANPYEYSPSQLTLEQAMFAYWVPKSWELLINVFSEDPNQPFQGSNIFNFSHQINSEEGFVCNPAFENPSPLGWSVENFEFMNARQRNSMAFKFSNPNATSAEDTNFSPYINGYFSIFNEANDDYLQIGNAIDYYPPTGYASVQAGNFSISIPYVILSQADPLGSYERIFLDFEISISEYWTYGGIYDQGTGNFV
jgi:hypothetical protein